MAFVWQIKLFGYRYHRISAGMRAARYRVEREMKANKRWRSAHAAAHQNRRVERGAVGRGG